MVRKLFITAMTTAVVLAGAACGSPAQDSAATTTPVPTSTPAATGSASPTTAANPGATTTAPPTAPEQPRHLTFIAMGDDGASGPMIGCGDSAVAVPVDAADAADLSALMRAQLAVTDDYYGQSGLYNALSHSTLQVESAQIRDGVARVELSGTLMLAGECDIPRVREQLTAPAMQFDGVREVEVLINGEPLESLLDLRG